MKKLALACCIVGGLTACGGDGGSDHPTAPPLHQAHLPQLRPNRRLTCCRWHAPRCGAVDANTYAGANVGVWRHVNATAAPVDVPVNIRGLSRHDVTLVFTNQGAEPQAMPALPLVPKASFSAVGKSWRLDGEDSAVMRRISEFNAHGRARLAATRPLAARQARRRESPRARPCSTRPVPGMTRKTSRTRRRWCASHKPATARPSTSGSRMPSAVFAKVGDATIDALAASFRAGHRSTTC